MVAGPEWKLLCKLIQVKVCQQMKPFGRPVLAAMLGFMEEVGALFFLHINLWVTARQQPTALIWFWRFFLLVILAAFVGGICDAKQNLEWILKWWVSVSHGAHSAEKSGLSSSLVVSFPWLFGDKLS